MFLLNSDDFFLKNSISLILHQKNIIHTLDKEKKYFFTLDIKKNHKILELRGSSKSLKIELPTTVNLIIKNIFNLFNGFKLDINGAQFFPLKQSLVYKNKETYLGNIHFIIFSQLILNKSDGLNKSELYKNIWPLDKEFQLNKLDTHLTNLKNHLNDKINFNLSSYTRSGLIYIRVN